MFGHRGAILKDSTRTEEYKPNMPSQVSYLRHWNDQNIKNSKVNEVDKHKIAVLWHHNRVTGAAKRASLKPFTFCTTQHDTLNMLQLDEAILDHIHQDMFVRVFQVVLKWPQACTWSSSLMHSLNVST